MAGERRSYAIRSMALRRLPRRWRFWAGNGVASLGAVQAVPVGAGERWWQPNASAGKESTRTLVTTASGSCRGGEAGASRPEPRPSRGSCSEIGHSASAVWAQRGGASLSRAFSRATSARAASFSARSRSCSTRSRTASAASASLRRVMLARIEMLGIDRELQPAPCFGLDPLGGDLVRLEDGDAALVHQGAALGIAHSVAVGLAGEIGQQGLAQEPDGVGRISTAHPPSAPG